MSYIPKIEEAYDRLGFKPRDNQLEHVNRIVGTMLDENARHVILSAPTGTGKSIIGAVVAEVVHTVKSPHQKPNASFLLTATNVLGQQYFDTFSNPDDPHDTTFRFLKGATNYECSALSTPEEPQKADNCSIRLFQKTGMEQLIAEHCNKCEFQINRSLRDKSRHLITNYSYYFTDRLSMELLAHRSVCVFDEAHLLNDLYTDHCAINFTERGLMASAQEISDALDLEPEVYKHLKMVQSHLAAEKIDDKTYQTYIRVLADVYTRVTEAAQQEAERSIRSPARYLKLTKIAKKYFGRAGKILDLLEHEYPHVFEYKAKNPKTGQNDHEVSIKPIFVSAMFEKLVNADHNLLMSATISEQYAKRTLTLEPADRVAHIRLPPQFPRENKKVIFFKPMSLNYTSMKDPETVKKLSLHATQIVQHHTDRGERGIVLAPSFNIVESIAGSLRNILDTRKVRIFEHVRGEKLVDWIEAFKAYDKGPAVLLTPSGFEGLDLPGDFSRFQIITKAPFGSLGDRRIKVILDTYPDIYSLTALMKITQGAGRSVRSSDDHAVTYMLDQGIQRLWTAKNNEWSDEFATSFKTVLD